MNQGNKLFEEKMNKPALCKVCRKLMGTADVCPYCHTKRQSIKANVSFFTHSITSQSSYSDMIFKVTVGIFILEVVIAAFVFRAELLSSVMSGPPGGVLLAMGASSPRLFVGHWWGLLTATFLHGGIMHIGFNMLAFKQISPLIEQVTTKSFFVVVYLLSGAGGFLLSALGGALSVGASAGLFGLIGCGMVVSYILGYGKDDPVFKSLSGWAIFGLIFGFVVPGIDNSAHIGGLVSGAGLGYLWTLMRMKAWFIGLTNKLSIALVVATVIGFIQCIMTYYQYL